MNRGRCEYQVSFRSGGDLCKREMSFVVICYQADSSRTEGMNWLTLMIDARLAIFAKNYHKSLLSEKGLLESALNPRNYGDEGGPSSFLRGDVNFSCRLKIDVVSSLRQ